MEFALIRSSFTHDTLLAPSILAANFATLGHDIAAVEEGGADLLHIDIMDGHFVPNLSMGPGVVSCIRKQSHLLFDVHLMLSEPSRYIDAFAKAGADHITIHVESCGNIAETIQRIHDNGCSAGITLRPGTPVDSLRPYLDSVEMALVMTVEPGFGGQSFMASQLPKIHQLRQWIKASGRPVRLEVDGGIAIGTASQAKAAGADVLVAGSSVFKTSKTFRETLEALRNDA